MDVVAEERRAALLATARRVVRVQVQSGRLESRGIGSRKDMDLGHPVQYDVPSVAGGSRMAQRVVGGRLLHQPGEQRALRDVEPTGVLAEVTPGRRLDAVRAFAEVDEVEVAAEDLQFAHPLL